MAGLEVTKGVKKPKEAEVKGSAQFENGQLKVPVKENGKVSMKTAGELKSILDKKEKNEKVNKSPISNTKQSKKVKQKKVAPSKARRSSKRKLLMHHIERNSLIR